MPSIRWLFRLAGCYGLLVLGPMVFMEASIGQDYPPAITHPEYYYGFLGVGLAWQIAFLVIATDPPRYRPLMLACVVEKFSFFTAAIVLFAQQRLPLPVLVSGLVDGLLGVGFLLAWRKTRPQNP